MAQTHILGYPRIGARCELKIALEAFWRKEVDESDLRRVGAELKLQRWHGRFATRGCRTLASPHLSA